MQCNFIVSGLAMVTPYTGATVSRPKYRNIGRVMLIYSHKFIEIPNVDEGEVIQNL